MPTYQYECQACGHSFDELQGMSEPKLKKCPQCRKAKLVRLIGGGSGMIFKGSGFYETDYKRKSSGADDKPKPEAKPSPAPAGACGGHCACHPH